MDAYVIENSRDYYGNVLKGPEGFECHLQEPEDRIWTRDGLDAVIRLNEQHDRLTTLEAENAKLRDLLRRINASTDAVLTMDLWFEIKSAIEPGNPGELGEG